MPAHPDLAALVAVYASLPGAPPKPSRSDWAVAHQLLSSGIDLPTLRAAMLLATLRRYLRPADQPGLEPVHSLAYYRPLALHLQAQPLDPGYLAHLDSRFRQLFPDQPSPLDETAAHRQNPAHLRRR